MGETAFPGHGWEETLRETVRRQRGSLFSPNMHLSAKKGLSR